jgi:NADH-quinone oxidoreductase subunit J
VIETIFFMLLALWVIISALWVVFAKNPMHSAVALASCLLGLALVFILLSASFVGMMQLMIYTGAVGILYVFIVTTYAKTEPKGLFHITREFFNIPRVIALIFSLLIFFIPVFIFFRMGYHNINLPPKTENMGDIGTIGAQLFTRYTVHFEILSVLILAGIVGIVAISQQSEKAQKDRKDAANSGGKI